MKLSQDLIQKVEKITSTDYGFNEDGETENWDILVEDLLMYYDSLLEEYNDYKEREITKYDIDY